MDCACNRSSKCSSCGNAPTARVSARTVERSATTSSGRLTERQPVRLEARGIAVTPTVRVEHRGELLGTITQSRPANDVFAPTAYAVAKPTGAVDWGENATRWVDGTLAIVRDRFRAGDQAAERDHLYRMAQQQFENDRDERAFRLRIEEIRARYGGGLQTQQFRVEDARREERKNEWLLPVAVGAVGLGALYFMTRK